MIRIEAFNPALQAGVIDVILPIQQDEFGVSVTLDDQPDLQQIPGFYQSGSGGFWLALDGPDVVGTIGLRDIGQGQAALRKMFVKASHRGSAHGVAGRLLDHLVAHAEGASVDEVFLGTTERFLAAHRFYEKNGFSRIDEAALPDRFPKMAVDSRFYRRGLRG